MMISIQGLEQWRDPGRPLYLALGNFDGVHRGHQSIIKRTVDLSRQRGGVAAVLLFHPHPRSCLQPGTPFPLLTGLPEKAEIIAALEVDYLVVQPFNLEVAALPPELFVKRFLGEGLKVSGVIIGEDYTFGRGAGGGASTLLRLGDSYGFEVEICPLLVDKDDPVSSTAIRRLISSGELSRAAELLNYYFFRSGKVVAGAGRGGRLLYPTANLEVTGDLLWPGPGVYLTAVEGVAGEPVFGVTHVGGTPTFNRETVTVETYILDFCGDLYHRTIKLYFLERLRQIISFATPEKLKNQIDQDILRAGELAAGRYRSFRGSFLETAGPINL